MEVQSNSNSVLAQNQAQDDWKIIHAIFKNLNQIFFNKNSQYYGFKIFENIAPLIQEVDNSNLLKYSMNQNTCSKKYTPNYLSIKKSNFLPLFDNYYQTDNITKSSITMAKCSSNFKNQSWPY